MKKNNYTVILILLCLYCALVSNETKAQFNTFNPELSIYYKHYPIEKEYIYRDATIYGSPVTVYDEEGFHYEPISLRVRPEIRGLCDGERDLINPDSAIYVSNIQYARIFFHPTTVNVLPKYLNSFKRLNYLAITRVDTTYEYRATRYGAYPFPTPDKDYLMPMNQLSLDSLVMLTMYGKQLPNTIYRCKDLEYLEFEFDEQVYFSKRLKHLNKLKYIKYREKKPSKHYHVPKVLRQHFSDVLIDCPLPTLNGKLIEGATFAKELRGLKKLSLSVDSSEWANEAFVRELSQLKDVEWLEINTTPFMESKVLYQKRLAALSNLSNLKVLVVYGANLQSKKDFALALPNTKIFCLGYVYTDAGFIYYPDYSVSYYQFGFREPLVRPGRQGKYDNYPNELFLKESRVKHKKH